MYITPPDTTGVVEYPPNSVAAVIGSVHATPSVETFDALIGPPTSRVFCRSAPGRLHAVESAEVVCAEVVVGTAVVLVLPPLPQAATSRLAATSKQNPASRAECMRTHRCRCGEGDLISFPVGVFSLIDISLAPSGSQRLARLGEASSQGLNRVEDASSDLVAAR